MLLFVLLCATTVMSAEETSPADDYMSRILNHRAMRGERLKQVPLDGFQVRMQVKPDYWRCNLTIDFTEVYAHGLHRLQYQDCSQNFSGSRTNITCRIGLVPANFSMNAKFQADYIRQPRKTEFHSKFLGGSFYKIVFDGRPSQEAQRVKVSVENFRLTTRAECLNEWAREELLLDDESLVKLRSRIRDELKRQFAEKISAILQGQVEIAARDFLMPLRYP